jgi:hypothetical protein
VDNGATLKDNEPSSASCFLFAGAMLGCWRTNVSWACLGVSRRQLRQARVSLAAAKTGFYIAGPQNLAESH